MAGKVFNLEKGVFSFNGRKGLVIPKSGDYTAEMVGAIKDYGSLKLYGDNERKIISSVGWYRIASDQVRQGTGSSSLFFLGNGYSSGGPSNLLLYVNFYKYNPEVIIMAYPIATNGAMPIDDARITYNADTRQYFLDIHYSLSASNELGLDCISSTFKENYPATIVFPEIALVDDAPDGEEILTYASWVSPPMKLGIEYRTTERYNRKPVYARLVNVGPFPSPGTYKEVSIETGHSSVELVSCSFKSGQWELPTTMFGGNRDDMGIVEAYGRVSSSKLLVYLYTKVRDLQSTNVTAYFKYTVEGS